MGVYLSRCHSWKRRETEFAIILHGHPLELECTEGVCEAGSDYSHASAQSEASFLFEFMIKSARKLMARRDVEVRGPSTFRTCPC